MDDANDSHSSLVVDPEDHAVRAASRAVPILERRPEPLAHSVWVLEQWADEELVRRERDRLRKARGQLSACGWRDDEFEALRRHAVRPRRRMASARSCSDSPSPRANSASEATNCRTAASSDRIAIVSSSASRSSGDSRIADGRP